MKTEILLLLFSSLFFFSTSISQYLYVGTEPVSISLDLYNEENIEEIFMINVFPQEVGGIKSFYNDRVWISPKSSKKVEIFFVSQKCIVEDIVKFEITAYPYSTPDKKIKKEITVAPKVETVFCLLPIKKDKEVVKPDDEIILETTAKNLGKNDYDAILKVYINKELISEENIKIQKFSTITKQYKIKINNNWNPGKYMVEIVLLTNDGKTLDLKEDYFFVTENRNIEQYSINEINFFYATSRFVFKNSGNVKSEPFYYVIEIPSLAHVFLRIISEKEIIKEGNVYKILVPSLDRNSYYSFEVKIALYPVWLISLIIIVIIVLVYWKYYTITIKKAIVSKEEEMKIKITVKNARKTKLKNVILRDFVPSLFKVSKDFEFFKPEINKKSFGIELIWNIGDLNPGEERIVTYKIKPIIELVGKFKLPKAVLKFKEGNKIKTIAISKSVVI
ncbi:MAG: hypothetical protein RMJ17_03515 [Candidatus Aenigmarchaeota archaeon]|nr:hypothetical protein [Candidatus Aenigmarchaeota archaeon]MDW8149634.1 hypothetical protein [Candidatus Aenigmarchaeota archaeon]